MFARGMIVNAEFAKCVFSVGVCVSQSPHSELERETLSTHNFQWFWSHNPMHVAHFQGEVAFPELLHKCKRKHRRSTDIVLTFISLFRQHTPEAPADICFYILSVFGKIASEVGWEHYVFSGFFNVLGLLFYRFIGSQNSSMSWVYWFVGLLVFSMSLV